MHYNNENSLMQAEKKLWNMCSAYSRYRSIWTWVLFIGWLVTVTPAVIGSTSCDKLARSNMLFITFTYETIDTYPVLSNQTCQPKHTQTNIS